MRPRCRQVTARIGTCFLIFLAFSAAEAQSVRPMTSPFSDYRPANREAERQGRADWPNVADGERGTQAHISYSLRDADMILLTDTSVSPVALLEEGRRIARELGWPKTDFLQRHGTRSCTLDLEFNKYIQKEKRRSVWELDLSRLAGILKKSTVLPQPVVLLVHADEPDSVLLTADGQQPQQLKKKTFLGLNEIPAGAVLRCEEHLEWYTPVLALFMAAFLLFSFGLVLVMPWHIQTLKARAAKQQKPAELPDPEIVQQRYNKQWPQIVQALIVPLLLTALFILKPERILKQALYMLPFEMPSPRWMMLLPVGILGSFGVSYLLAVVVEKRRRRTSPDTVEDNETNAKQTGINAGLAFLPMLVVTLILPVLILLPGFNTLPRNLRVGTVVVLGISGFVGMLFLSWRNARKQQTVLNPGDYWHDAVMQMAREGGVRVARVIRLQSDNVNAMVSLGGKMMLTDGLLNRLEPEEVRAIIAHEIGHLKYHHVRKSFAIGLTVIALLITLQLTLLPRLRPHIPEEAYLLLQGPTMGIFLFPIFVSLLTGHWKRRYEEEADLHAVEATGDSELVIRSLTKVHTLNAQPYSLKPADEILHSHPSLTHRIDAIRRRF